MCFEKDEGRGTEVDTKRHEKRRGEERKKGRIGKEDRRDGKGRREGRKDGGMKGVGRKDEKGEGRHNLKIGRAHV